MSFFKTFGKRDNQNYNVNKLLLSVIEAGGKAVIKVPYEVFIDYANANCTILGGSAGSFKCKLSLEGENFEAQFIAGALHLELQADETYIEIKQTITGQASMLAMANLMAEDMNKVLSDANVALAVLWMIKQKTWMRLQDFHGDVFGAGYEESETHRKIIELVTEGHDMFSERQYEFIQKNVGGFDDNDQYMYARNLFVATLRTIGDFDSTIRFSDQMMEKVLSHYESLKTKSGSTDEGFWDDDIQF